MAPALTEAVTKGHGLHLPSLFSSRSLDTSATECMENQRPTHQRRVPQTNCSSMRYPNAKQALHKDIVNIKHIGSPVAQSSPRYQTVFLLRSNSSLNLPSGQPQNLKEGDTCKVRRHFNNGTRQHFSGLNHSKPETQVKRELFPGSMTKLFADVNNILDVTNKESCDAGDVQVPKCTFYGRNGWVGKALAGKQEPKTSDLLDCTTPVLHGIPGFKNSSTLSKEMALNSRLMQCLSKQQTLHNRAKRTQKHLHSLLAKQVVDHCSQQMRCFVKHQLQRIHLLHKPSRPTDCNSNEFDNIKTEPGKTNLDNSTEGDFKNVLDRLPSEVWRFAQSSAALLSHVEGNLDSDATESSSDEDWEEHPLEKASISDCGPEWRWQADRARIGSRWTWLQAQISQLEFKIQRLTDIYRQLRASKGTVILEELPLPKDVLKQSTPQPKPAASLNTAESFKSPSGAMDSSLSHDFEMSPSSPTLLLRNIEKQSAQLTEIVSSLRVPLNLSPTSSPRSSKSCSNKRLANGIFPGVLHNRKDVSSSHKRSSDQQHIKKRKKDSSRARSPSMGYACTSARSRPLHCLHRRKLYRLYSAGSCYLQAIPSRDAGLQSDRRPTTLPAPPWSSCDFSIKSWLPEVDASFHPVLSLPSDLPLRIHLETSLKNNYEINGHFTDYVAHGEELKMSHSNELELDGIPSRSWGDVYCATIKPQAHLEVLKQSSEGRKKRHVSETDAESERHFEEFFSVQQGPPDSQLASPLVSDLIMPRSSHKSSTQGIMRRRLRSESSYDIDNIVIPMSLVASTKVEKLQYKEILTPSWRAAHLEPFEGLVTGSEELEDLSDEVFSSRHEKYEEKEKARWSLWVQANSQRRTSRCSSKTPEGLQGQSMLLNENSNSSYTLVHCSPDVAPATLSFEMSNSETAWVPQCSDDGDEEKPVLWEPRVFPLSEEDAAALLSQCEMYDWMEKPSVLSYSDCSCIPACTEYCSLKPRLSGDVLDVCKSAHLASCYNTKPAR